VCEWLPDVGHLRRIETTNSYNDPALQAERFMIVSTANTAAAGGAESEVLASVYREHEYIALAPASSLPNGLEAVERLSSLDHITSARLYLVSRDYGMHDRKEAPQYFKAVGRNHLTK